MKDGSEPLRSRLIGALREFKMVWSYAGKTSMFGHTYYRIPWFFHSLKSAVSRFRHGSPWNWRYCDWNR